MKYKIKTIFSLFRVMFILPGVNWKDEFFMKDLLRWKVLLSINGNKLRVLALLLSRYPEFRNLFIFRTHGFFYTKWVKLIYPPMKTLYFETPTIGGGLFIQHGFSTMVAAKSIGENCWINQQVTVGHTDVGKAPIIGNNVKILCGAKVLGSITVGDNAIIGANACVVKDVEPNAVVGGVPAKVIKYITL